MSGYLWNSFYQDDVEGFRSFLSAGQGGMKTTSNRVKTSSSIEATGRSLSFGSPGSLGTSPVLAKQKKAHGYSAQDGLTRQDINRRDHLGRTLLHLIASSRHDSTIDFATALLDFPLTDIYLQDYENGWTALHRAFYFGNVSIARSILWRETQDVLNHAHGTPKHPQPLIKIKDHEGNGPYDLLFMTLAAHSRRSTIHRSIREGTEGIRDDTSSTDETLDPTQSESIACISEQLGDEVFTFGSNKNVTLGFGDEDDRQFPERITLRRPVGLIEKQFLRYLESRSHFYGSDTNEGNMRMRNGYVDIAEVPFSVKSIPIRFRDIQMSKFHTAILTTDQESNLYICGHGKGGRLGFGDERTRYQFACVDSGGLGTKEVVQVALGHNHTLAVTSDGSVYSWGMNTFGQLGYQLSNIRPNEEPLQLVPRQIYGTLKRERVAGVAASRIHSVVFTPLSLFTFGKNEGQLGIVDSDARSLSSQASPRKVAASLFSTTISTVAAIDRATICLLANHEVWVFANYGYRRLTFPLDGFSNFFMHQVHTIPSWEDIPNRICHITGGGNTICAMSSMGEVFTCVVSLPTEMGDSHASTTNPSKIKGSFSQPRRVWSIKKGHMSARNVAVDQDGSIILATEAGTVWRQVKRSKAKHTTASEIGSQSKDYKFTRIPNLTRVCKVRASAFGAYAVIRQEYDVTKTDILDTGSPLWEAYARLMPFEELVTYATTGDHPIKLSAVEPKVQQLFSITKGIESLALKDTKDFPLEPIVVYTSLGNWGIPIHRWLLVGRSNVIRRSLNSHAHMDFLHVEETENCTRLQFEGLDPMTLFNFVYWLYTDEVVECWQFPKNARARNVRADLIRLAHRLELTGLEFAVRQIDSRRRLDDDMRIAYSDAELFTDADVLVELEDGQVSAHSEILCQRCPFFDGLFKGRTGGLWLQGRTSESGKVSIDLKHFSSETFGYVLRHIYSDAGIELFDNIQCPKVEDFLDRVLDVMAIANELLLDRLSLVCQKVIGKHVNLRNVCELLNVIAPSPAGAFRHAALDYICFNLEVLLQNGYLDELDNDLLIEVNQRVREEQRYHARAKEDDEELLLRWPELSKRRIRWGEVSIDPAMLGEKSVRDASKFPSTSFVNPLDHHPLSLRMGRGKVAISDDVLPPSPPRPSQSAMHPSQDMIFDLEDDGFPVDMPELGRSPIRRMDTHPRPIPKPDFHRNLDISNTPSIVEESAGKGPWNVALDSSKLTMKEIMDQASSSRVSNISLGLESAISGGRKTSNFGGKPSQKQRKKAQTEQPKVATPKQGTSSSPWKIQPSKTNSFPSTSSGPATSIRNASTPLTMRPLTMRQTVANTTPHTNDVPRTPETKRTASSQWATSTPGSSPTIDPSTRQRSENAMRLGPRPDSSGASKPTPAVHSVRHIQPTTSIPTEGLSMVDILSQQQAEKDVIHEMSTTKRNLQDIQAEQEFQQWWDQESRRVMEEERKSPAGDQKSKPTNRRRKAKKYVDRNEQLDRG